LKLPKGTSLPLRPHELHILVALAGGERHGYAIQQEVEARSKGALRLGPGTLYETIARLLERELIREVAPQPGEIEHAQRRYYALTAKGRRLLSAEVDRLAGVVRIARERLKDSET
jgi:DNA-binding PadR family transcriptional regulator